MGVSEKEKQEVGDDGAARLEENITEEDKERVGVTGRQTEVEADLLWRPLKGGRHSRSAERGRLISN